MSSISFANLHLSTHLYYNPKMTKIYRLIYALAVLAVELAIITASIYEPGHLQLFPTEWLIMAAGLSVP